MYDRAVKQLVLLTIELLVAIVKGWPQIKLQTTKNHVQSFVHVFDD